MRPSRNAVFVAFVAVVGVASIVSAALGTSFARMDWKSYDTVYYGPPPVPAATATAVGPADDSDDDGCPDMKELAIGLDPKNRWDFYSVPVPALFAAPNPTGVIRDGIVSSGDAQAVFAYFKASAKAGKPVYDQDLNADGIPDGTEYDRSVVGAGASGAPSGVVGAAAAQVAFAQFRRRYHC